MNQIELITARASFFRKHFLFTAGWIFIVLPLHWFLNDHEPPWSLITLVFGLSLSVSIILLCLWSRISLPIINAIILLLAIFLVLLIIASKPPVFSQVIGFAVILNWASKANFEIDWFESFSQKLEGWYNKITE